MDIQVRIRFGSSKQFVEKFGDRRYMVYILSKEDEADHMQEVLALLSRSLGVEPSKFELKRDKGRDKVFSI